MPQARGVRQPKGTLTESLVGRTSQANSATGDSMLHSLVTHSQQKIVGTPEWKIRYALTSPSLRSDGFIYAAYRDNQSEQEAWMFRNLAL